MDESQEAKPLFNTEEWAKSFTTIYEFEQKGLVTRTFRRLDPIRQQTIINAILEEAAERGPAEINIKRVAERAGVAVGSLYQYFENREGLLNFATELVVRNMVDDFTVYSPMLAEQPLREALTYYLVGGFEWATTKGGFLRFFARAAYSGDSRFSESVVIPVAEAMRKTTTTILVKANERGEIRAGVDLEATARVVNALLIAIADPQLLPYLNLYFQVLDEDISPQRLIDAALDMIMKGITPNDYEHS